MPHSTPHSTPRTTPRIARRTPRLALRRLGAGLALSLGLSASLALAAQAQAAPSPAPEAARASMSAPFRVATFNILGANHTLHGRNGFATYESRMVKTIALLERRELGIVGFQEYQGVQHEMFMRRTEGAYGVYPGLEAGRRPLANSIVWRKSDWSIVEKRLYKIPYFRGKLVEQPYVKLRNDEGVEVWVINTHNPADAKGPAQKYRNRAMAIQAELADDLERTGVPVILLGDFNERDEAFCAITGGSDLKAVNGGGWPDGRCDPPSWMRIDWIFVSKSAEVVDYVDLENKVTQYITDHHLIYSDLSVPVS
jgi:endonuclease/exonuclease/phosphatase family metal-dependent hydrolase